MAETVEKLTTGEPLTIDQLLEYLPALKEIPRAQLENWAKGAAVLHHYRKGEIVCEEGEFGSTAYYIVSGTVDIFIHNPLAHLRTHPVRSFLGRSMRRMKSFLTDDQTDHRPEAHQRKFIGIDANIDLPINRPLAQLGPGELFGEMTCRTYQPRSATVQAREPCIMVEMLRVILDMLVGNRQPSELTKATSKVKMPTFNGTSFQAELEKKYRERSLNNHLRAVPLFAPLDDEFIEHLRQHVELVSYNQSQIICQEGEEADAFYLIRSGMVRVSNALPGGDMVRTYLSRGDYFGEIGLLRSVKRTATCAALDAVDVVKIPGAEFNLMLEKFPAVRQQIEAVADARLEAGQRKIPTGLHLDDFLNQGLFEAQNLLLIDLENCTRCDACVRACAQAQVKIEKKKMTAYKANTCDLCTQLSTPSCVYACPHDAAKRVDPQRFFGDAITAQSELIGATWAPMPARYETHHTH